MRRYLVTGGAGFIGSHIVGALLQQGAQVRVLDNFSTGRRENVEALRGGMNGTRLEVLDGDLRDPRRVAEAVRGTEIIFHEAAFVSAPQSIDKPQECFEVNTAGTSILFEAARTAGVQRVVIASSAAVYGDSDALPLTEVCPPRPLSPYAASKVAAEIYAALYTQAYGLDVIALRYFNVYGPRQRPDSPYAAAVPIFIRTLLDGEAVTIFGDGGQTRDLIYVSDVVRANLIVAEHPAAAGQVFNICTGQATRITDLFSTLSKLVPGGQSPKLAATRAGDIYESLGSPAKAESVLGFRAGTSLRQGLEETVKWMQ